MIRLINTSFGMVIGEDRGDRCGDGGIMLQKPRQLMIQNDDKGMTHFAVGEYPWKPTTISIPANQVAFDVTEEELLKAYKQATTGLVLAHSGEIQKPH